MRILLMESIPLLEEALVNRLHHSGHNVTTRAPVSMDLIDQISTQTNFELLWIDTCIFSEGSSQLMKRIRNLTPSSKILLFGLNETIPMIKNYYVQGGHGYLKKGATFSEIDMALSRIGNNEIYISLSLNLELTQWLCHETFKKPKPMDLTPREKEILNLIVEEYTTKEMARKLFICPSTVETHRLKLIQKLGVKNTAGLVRVAMETGLHTG